MTSPTHRVDGCAIISTRAFYVFKFIGQPDKLLVLMLTNVVFVNYLLNECLMQLTKSVQSSVKSCQVHSHTSMECRFKYLCHSTR